MSLKARLAFFDDDIRLQCQKLYEPYVSSVPVYGVRKFAIRFNVSSKNQVFLINLKCDVITTFLMQMKANQEHSFECWCFFFFSRNHVASEEIKIKIKLRSCKIKIELRSFKSSEHINERRDGPYHGFGYLSLFSDPLDLAKWGQREQLTY